MFWLSNIIEHLLSKNFQRQSVMTEENSRNGVQRNLFGTVPSDHAKTQENLFLEAKRITKEKSQKWNFDFENFQPLPGRYKWERVGKRLQHTRRSPTPENTEASQKTCISKRHYNLRQRDSSTQENIGPHQAALPPSTKKQKQSIKKKRTLTKDTHS